MAIESGADISGYHAHVYYEAATREAAAELRNAIEARFDVRMGRWHDRPIGPHPMWSYQVAFAADLFADIVPWLALNHGELTVFIHPETGDDIADHTRHALWLGRQREIDISALE
ncbi:MAG: DOPA 4,5-dioxygenase family protein [Alphaproteobacteria bacterium]|nr:DOPA 4,5-dioxygenase family protein [Alphaproteobacteria bacterium]